jgi:hypothetical protein
MLITKSNNFNAGARKRTVGKEVKFGPLSMQFISIILFATLAVLYLAQSTQSATKSYKMRELEDKKIQLQDDKDRLEIESTRLKSLNEINDKTKDAQLENSNKINYLSNN